MENFSTFSDAKTHKLSLDKYCSVAKTLDKTAVITSSFEINE